MKKLLPLILCGILLLSLSACSGNPRQESGTRNSEQAEPAVPIENIPESKETAIINVDSVNELQILSAG